MRVCHTEISVAVDYSPAFLCTWNNNRDVEVHSLDSLLKNCDNGKFFDEGPEGDQWWSILDDFKKPKTFKEVVADISENTGSGGFCAAMYFRDSILSMVVLQRIK